MEIKEKCPNCHKPNLINRPWRSKVFQDIWCGWCGSEYKMVDSKLVLFEVHNNHMTEKEKERQRKIVKSIVAPTKQLISREYSGVLSG